MIKSVFLGINQNCNQNCIFCSNPKELINHPLNFEEIISLIKDLKDNRAIDLRLYGGEPFLNQNILEIIEYATNQSMQLSIYTNGTIMNKQFEDFFKQNSIKKMFVSIDGPNAKIHEKIRQSPGSFDITIENIKTFIKLGITVDILFTVCALNKDHIFETYELLNKIGINDIKCNLVSPVGLAENNWQKVKLTNREIKNVSKIMIDSHKHFFGKEPKRKACHAGVNEIFIKANGNIYPCAMFTQDEYMIGNIRNDSFFNIYNSSLIIKKFKDIFENQTYCSNCSIKTECGGGCRARAFAIHQDLSKPDIISCAINRKSLP